MKQKGVLDAHQTGITSQTRINRNVRSGKNNQLEKGNICHLRVSSIVNIHARK